MLRSKSIAVVVPAFNEATQIGKVIRTVPDFVDSVVVIDDASADQTSESALAAAREAGTADRLVLLRHEHNQGVGAAIATGYIWCRDHGIDCAVVMAGDGQMQPECLELVCGPVVDGQADYAKANRLITDESYRKIPLARFLGNSALSFLTKIASGYWHIADSQSGFAAIGRLPLRTIDWTRMYPRYGQPNDILVRLNIHNFRVVDVPMEPVYGVGEQSKMRKRKVVFTISWLLARLFLYRMRQKYIYREFHPLVFFYLLGVALLAVAAAFAVRFVVKWEADGVVPEVTLLALLFSSTTGLMCLFFAMLFDMERGRQ